MLLEDPLKAKLYKSQEELFKAQLVLLDLATHFLEYAD